MVGSVHAAADRSLERWTESVRGAPRLLGLINANGPVTIRQPLQVTLQTMPVFTVSLEPKGGTPTPRAPSGRVYKGAWVRVQYYTK
ncbi:anti-sigma factor domain-containing protein [Noviherbaspirillum humi]|uniref:anti-sigma factor domain-containing protein n=1 Tax=Noviherbaspirillum humi TaxID=1688639 RepID=UPI000B77C0ED